MAWYRGMKASNRHLSDARDRLEDERERAGRGEFRERTPNEEERRSNGRYLAVISNCWMDVVQ